MRVPQGNARIACGHHPDSLSLVAEDVGGQPSCYGKASQEQALPNGSPRGQLQGLRSGGSAPLVVSGNAFEDDMNRSMQDKLRTQQQLQP
jgi:hypothetical protein